MHMDDAPLPLFSPRIKTPLEAFQSLIRRQPSYAFLCSDLSAKEKNALEKYYTKSKVPTPCHPTLLTRPFDILHLPPEEIRGIILFAEIFANESLDSGLPMEFLSLPTDELSLPPSRLAFEHLFDYEEEEVLPLTQYSTFIGDTSGKRNLDIMTDNQTIQYAFEDLQSNRRRFPSSSSFMSGGIRSGGEDDDDDGNDTDEEDEADDDVYAVAVGGGNGVKQMPLTDLASWAKQHGILLWSFVASANHRDRIELYPRRKKGKDGEIVFDRNIWYPFTRLLVQKLQQVHSNHLPMLVFGAEPATLCRDLQIDEACLLFGACDRLPSKAIVSPLLLETFLAKTRQHASTRTKQDTPFSPSPTLASSLTDFSNFFLANVSVETEGIDTSDFPGECHRAKGKDAKDDSDDDEDDSDDSDEEE